MIVSILLPAIQADLALTDSQLGVMMGGGFALFYALAGVPLTNGASVLEGFVPEFDAPVITRLLSRDDAIASGARALFGEKLKDLRTEVEADVARSVAFFLAACRHGGIS